MPPFISTKGWMKRRNAKETEEFIESMLDLEVPVEESPPGPPSSQTPTPDLPVPPSQPPVFLKDLVDTSSSPGSSGIDAVSSGSPPTSPSIEGATVPVRSGSVNPRSSIFIPERDITLDSTVPCNVSGHFCDLFTGKHTRVGKVALKRLRISNRGSAAERQAMRFFREADTWQGLRHPFILEFVGIYQSSGHIYLVSPFIENRSMTDYIEEHPETDRLRLLDEAADALAYLHTCGIIHGDVKSHNILITSDIHALLCDFGLTKLADSSTSTEMKGAGTVRWQSPELMHNAPKSFKSDVYAFGITIYEVLSGKIPYSTYTHSTVVILAVIRGEGPPLNPLVSSTGQPYDAAWMLAQECWDADPDHRPSMSATSTQLRLARDTSAPASFSIAITYRSRCQFSTGEQHAARNPLRINPIRA